jgi:hypothetical protein
VTDDWAWTVAVWTGDKKVSDTTAAVKNGETVLIGFERIFFAS